MLLYMISFSLMTNSNFPPQNSTFGFRDNLKGNLLKKRVENGTSGQNFFPGRQLEFNAEMAVFHDLEGCLPQDTMFEDIKAQEEGHIHFFKPRTAPNGL